MQRRKYWLVACHVLWRELSYYAALSPHCLQITFLKQGLHNTPDILRRELQAAVDAVPEGEYDAILLGYGLCSNGIVGIESRHTPLVAMRGHDCITFLLGSKERYREYFDSHPGTYWYSPGWIDCSTQPSQERYEKMLAYYTSQYGEENADYLMRSTENWMYCYNNAAYVDLGFGDSDAYQAFTLECAAWLKWNCDVLTGDSRLVRDFVGGNWNPEDFLVVQPGEKIVASHDAMILGAAKTNGEVK